MAFFNTSAAERVARLTRENATLRAERDGFKAERDALDGALVNARRELAEAKAVQPPNLTEVTYFLRAYVPTIPMAPAYSFLAKATSADSYAQALSLLLRHAHLVGSNEARANS